MSNYFYGTVPLSNILQSGSDVVTGFYNVSGNTVSTISFDITNSTASKPNPIPFPYQYLNPQQFPRQFPSPIYPICLLTCL